MKFELLIKNYEVLKLKIRKNEIQEQEIRELQGFSLSSGENGMPKTNQNSSTPEKQALKLKEISEQRKSLQENLTQVRKQISDLIILIPNLISQEVVEMKVFIQNCGWKYISKKTGLSESYCRFLYREGVKEINERWESEYEIQGSL